jgi:hypothetical protein
VPVTVVLQQLLLLPPPLLSFWMGVAWVFRRGSCVQRRAHLADAGQRSMLALFQRHVCCMLCCTSACRRLLALLLLLLL